MTSRGYKAVLAAAVVVALVAPPAQARPAKIIQQPHLTARPKISKWESRPVPGVVYLHVYLHGAELEQHYIGGCRASNTNGVLFVWVRVVHCAASIATPTVFAVRYLSVSAPVRFVVRLTRSASG